MPNIFDQAEKELNNFIQKDILSYSKNRNGQPFYLANELP